MSIDEVPAASIIVNLFEGGPSGGLRKMQGNICLTPNYSSRPVHAEQFNRHRDTKKELAEATPSTHCSRAIRRRLRRHAHSHHSKRKDESAKNTTYAV